MVPDTEKQHTNVHPLTGFYTYIECQVWKSMKFATKFLHCSFRVTHLCVQLRKEYNMQAAVSNCGMSHGSTRSVSTDCWVNLQIDKSVVIPAKQILTPHLGERAVDASRLGYWLKFPFPLTLEWPQNHENCCFYLGTHWKFGHQRGGGVGVI